MDSFKTIVITPELKIEDLVKEVIQSEAAEVILEVTDEATLLQNEINLRMLKFYAEEEEKEITIKASDHQLLALAQRLGISTFKENVAKPLESSRELYADYQKSQYEVAAAPETPAQEKTLRGPRQRQRSFMPALAITVFTLALAVWWFLQPQTVVLVYPKEQTLNFGANAQIGPSFSDEDIPNGNIPAKLLEKVSQTSVQVAATGQKMVGVTAAVGRVAFINSGEQPVVIPKGSVLLGKQGVRFTTANDILVPKAVPQYESGIRVGTKWGRAEVDITAVIKGTLGNQPAKSITALETKKGFALQVVNFSPTRNGADKRVAVVTLEDVKRAENEAKQQMQLTGPDEIQGLVGQDYVLLPNLVKLEVIRFNATPEIGRESSVVRLNLDYKVSTIAPTQVGVKKFLFKQLTKNTPAEFQPLGGKVNLVAAKVLSSSAGQARVELHGKGQIRGVLNSAKIKNMIKGKSITEAKESLLAQEEISDVNIDIKNDGTVIPNFGFQIKVIFPQGAKPR